MVRKPPGALVPLSNNCYRQPVDFLNPTTQLGPGNRRVTRIHSPPTTTESQKGTFSIVFGTAVARQLPGVDINTILTCAFGPELQFDVEDELPQLDENFMTPWPAPQNLVHVV